MTYIIRPDGHRFASLWQFVTPASHHDSSVSTTGNRNLFMRQKQLVAMGEMALPSAEEQTIIARSFKVPGSLSDIFDELTLPQLIGVAILKHFITTYSSGAGLFDGQERYRILDDRAKQAAIRANSIFGFWGDLCLTLQVPAAGSDDNLLALMRVPNPIARLVFADMAKNIAATIYLARAWFDTERKGEHSEMIPNPKPIHDGIGEFVPMEVPSVNANTIRHQLREHGALHLLRTLGLEFNDLPDGVAGLLYNGGDLNSSAPSDAYTLARTIKANYPLLGLLGGSTKGFILGASNLNMAAWLVCRENNAALAQFGVESKLSAFELIDDAGMANHTAGRVAGSPMPFGFEALVQGAEIVVDFRFTPYATQLELGAFWTALGDYLNLRPIFGGQSARGYGLFQDVATLIHYDAGAELEMDDYAEYITQNAEMLAEGLKLGTLGTGKVVC